MGNLHRLDNGTWIDLLTIIEIKPLYSEYIQGVTIPAGVLIKTFYNTIHEIPFDTNEDATRYADSLAELVNAAQNEPAAMPSSG